MLNILVLQMLEPFSIWAGFIRGGSSFRAVSNNVSWSLAKWLNEDGEHEWCYLLLYQGTFAWVQGAVGLKLNLAGKNVWGVAFCVM